MATPRVQHAGHLLGDMTSASPLPPMEVLDLNDLGDLGDLPKPPPAMISTSDSSVPVRPPSSPSLPRPEADGFRFSDLDLVSEALVLTSYARFKGLVKKENTDQWIEINGLEKLEKNCGYHTENGIPIRRISSTELVIGGKIRMMLEILPIGAASPARGRYLATLRGYFDRSTGIIALEALSQMKFENGIPLAHYNRDGPSDKCTRVYSFDKIRVGTAYMVAYTDGLLKLKRISQSEIYIHYKRRREALVVRSQEIKTGKIEAIRCKKRTPLVDAASVEDKENVENHSGFPFPAAGKRRSPSKRRASMAPSQLAKSQHASEAKSNGSRGGGGFGIFRFFFSGLSSSSSASSTNGKSRSSPLKNTSRRSPAGRNNRRKSMGEALFSAKEREKEEQAASMAAPPPPPPPAPAPPPPPFATPMAPPPPGSALRSRRGLPGQLGDGVTPNSRKKMRSLYWSVIPKDKLQQTLWCSQEVLCSPSINVNVTALESLFSLSPDKRNAGKFTPKSSKEAKQSPLVSILTLPRMNNIAILLSRFKISEDEIKRAIITMDDTVLSQENVNALLYIAPKDEEVRALRTFKEKMDPTTPLGKVERFIFSLIDIPRLEKRLELFQWKLQLDPSVAETLKSLASLSAACDEVKASKRLPVLLKAILLIGQVLNRDSYLFNSDGFRVESLMKLTETKGKDNSTTMLDYLVQEVEDKMAELLQFGQDLPSVEAAAKVQLEFLTAELNKMRLHLTQIQHELKIVSLQQHMATTNTLANGEAGEEKKRMFYTYGEVITALYEQASAKVKQVSEALDDAVAKWRELALFYGEDGEKMMPQQFFGIMNSFVQQFNTAHAESIKRKERAERERLRREKAERERLAKEEELARKKQMEEELAKLKEIEEQAEENEAGDASSEAEADEAEIQESEQVVVHDQESEDLQANDQEEEEEAEEQAETEEQVEEPTMETQTETEEEGEAEEELDVLAACEEITQQIDALLLQDQDSTFRQEEDEDTSTSVSDISNVEEKEEADVEEEPASPTPSETLVEAEDGAEEDEEEDQADSEADEEEQAIDDKDVDEIFCFHRPDGTLHEVRYVDGHAPAVLDSEH